MHFGCGIVLLTTKKMIKFHRNLVIFIVYHIQENILEYLSFNIQNKKKLDEYM